MLVPIYPDIDRCTVDDGVFFLKGVIIGESDLKYVGACPLGLYNYLKVFTAL